MATQYQITLTDALSPPRREPLVLPAAEEINYAIGSATITWRDPLTDYRAALAEFGAAARYEQFRLQNSEFVIWSPDQNAGPLTVDIEESDLWNGAIRNRSFVAVMQMPNYRYTPQGDTFQLIFLYSHVWVDANGYINYF